MSADEREGSRWGQQVPTLCPGHRLFPVTWGWIQTLLINETCEQRVSTSQCPLQVTSGGQRSTNKCPPLPSPAWEVMTSWVGLGP